MNSVVSEYPRKLVSSGRTNSASISRITQEQGQNGTAQERCLLLIDGRTLDRECLSKALTSRGLGMSVSAIGSIEEWSKEKEFHPAVGAILFNIGSRKLSDTNLVNEITRLTSEFWSVPVVILADTDDLSQIMKALECGACGYIPTSVDVDVCIGAIKLAVAGGIFLPASSVMAFRHVLEPSRPEPQPLSDMFTLRQGEVVKALSKGKANKIIAYELNLRESTVKVHIRNIMKKLKATNRTEVAYKIKDLFPSESLHS